MVKFAISDGENQRGMPRMILRGCCATYSHLAAGVFNLFSAAPRGNKRGMIRNSLAGFYFYADDTLSSPGPWMLLALDFLAVFCELDQLFTTV